MLLIVISMYIRNYIFFSLVLIFLFFIDRRFVIVYFLILHLLLFTSSIKINFIPIGLIDYKKGSYYIVDKFVYKTKIKINDDLYPGDIIYTLSYDDNYNDSDNKKNIIYIEKEYSKIYSSYIRKTIHKRIDLIDEPIRNNVYGFLFNVYSYDDNISIIYGLSSYYLLQEIRKKNNKLCIILIILLSILISFQFKYLFIMVDIIAEKNKLDRYLKLSSKLFLVSLINFNMFKDYSILIPLLFSLYSVIESDLHFNNYLMIIQLFLFSEINIVGVFLFRYLIKYRIVLFILSFILVFIPYFPDLYMFLINSYSYLSNLNISIRGSPSLYTIFMFLLIYRFIKNKNHLIETFLIILLILNPLNSPFGHISFIDVGQGDSIMIKNSLNKSCLLIDTGSIYNYHKLKKYLYSQSIYTIDYLIISHDDSDHNGNIDSLKRDFNIKEIIYEGKDIKYDDLYLKYYDLGKHDNDNDNSLVYGLDIKGINFLFTGDISKNVERLFVYRYGPYKTDVLKLAHHGSDTSTSDFFISEVLPEYAIISTSGQYNHPKKSVMDTLKKYGVKSYNTKYDKTISFYFTRYFNFIKTGNNEFVIIR